MAQLQIRQPDADTFVRVFFDGEVPALGKDGQTV